MSNFTFLQSDWPDLYETAREAEQNVNSTPRTYCFYARRSLERAVKWLTQLTTISSNPTPTTWPI